MSHLGRLLLLLSLTLTCGVEASAQRLEGISRNDFAEYVWWLELDDSQKAIAWEMFGEYRRQYESDLLERLRAYHGKLPAPNARGFVEALAANRDERAALSQALAEIDERLFGDLAALLRDDQPSRIQRVRYARQRQIHQTGRNQLPEGNVDLARLLLSLELTAEERSAIHEVLDWYEPQLIAALERSGEANRRYYPLMHKYADVTAEARRTDLTDHERATLLLQADQIHAEIAQTLRRPGERLVALNRQCLQQLLTALNSANQAALRRAYLEESYPEVYPDPASAEPLYLAALSIEGLDAGLIAQVEALREQYAREHSLLSTELAEAFMTRRRALRGGGPGTDASRDRGFDQIFEIGLEREALNLAQGDRLRAVLTPEQAASLPEWDFTKNPPERPWDWGNRIRREEAFRAREDRRRR